MAKSYIVCRNRIELYDLIFVHLSSSTHKIKLDCFPVPLINRSKVNVGIVSQL